MARKRKIPRSVTSIYTVEESWDWLIQSFVIARWHEGPENVAKIKKIVNVLSAEVEAARDDADLMDRGLPPERPTLRARLDSGGLTNDPAAEWDYKMITANVAQGWNMHRVTDVRSYAAFIKSMPVWMHEAMLDIQNRFRIERGKEGRPSSFAMDRLLEDADRMNVSDHALAKKLAKADLKPEGPGSEGVGLAAQWLVVIKAARYRRRRKG